MIFRVSQYLTILALLAGLFTNCKQKASAGNTRSAAEDKANELYLQALPECLDVPKKEYFAPFTNESLVRWLQEGKTPQIYNSDIPGANLPLAAKVKRVVDARFVYIEKYKKVALEALNATRGGKSVSPTQLDDINRLWHEVYSKSTLLIDACTDLTILKGLQIHDQK